MRPDTPLTATSPFMGAIAAAMATFLAIGAFLLVKAGTPMAKTGTDGLLLLTALVAAAAVCERPARVDLTPEGGPSWLPGRSRTPAVR